MLEVDLGIEEVSGRNTEGTSSAVWEEQPDSMFLLGGGGTEKGGCTRTDVTCTFGRKKFTVRKFVVIKCNIIWDEHFISWRDICTLCEMLNNQERQTHETENQIFDYYKAWDEENRYNQKSSRIENQEKL